MRRERQCADRLAVDQCQRIRQRRRNHRRARLANAGRLALDGTVMSFDGRHFIDTQDRVVVGVAPLDLSLP